MMRSLIFAAASLVALAAAGGSVMAAGATAPAAEPAAPRLGPGPSSGITQDDIIQQHPSWFSENGIPYRPCPCSVIFPNGRHACLGLP